MAKTEAKQEAPKPKDDRALQAELREEHEWRMRLHDEVASLKQENEKLLERSTCSVQSILIERDELMARVNRLEMRCRGLGIDIGMSNRGHPLQPSRWRIIG